MLTRRKLFGLFAAAPLSLVGAANKEPGPNLYDMLHNNNAPDKFNYRGYKIMWSGWKPSQDSLLICGQWLAHNPSTKKYFYMNSGGKGAAYHSGDMLDIRVSSERYHTDIDSSVEKLSYVRIRSLDQLMKLLHEEGF